MGGYVQKLTSIRLRASTGQTPQKSYFITSKFRRSPVAQSKALLFPIPASRYTLLNRIVTALREGGRLVYQYHSLRTSRPSRRRDPAAQNGLVIFLSYPGLHAK